ncbi:MAG: GGDEF domain-containing protein [Planctomycetota bacterium]|nr:GGDEF domain-containing protein [Planctomycetota bacterium]
MSHNTLTSRPGDWPLPPDPGESRLLLDLFPDPLIVARGPSRKLLAVNRAFMDLVGISEQGDLRDRPVTEWIHENDRHRLLSLGGDGESDPVPVMVQIRDRDSWRSVAIIGGRRLSPFGEERWVYRLKVLEDSGIGLEKQMQEQRKRASEAVRTSLRIFHLTEKIRMAPRLSTLLIGVTEEQEFYSRAGQLLSSEGLGYRSVSFWKTDEEQRELIWGAEDVDPQHLELPDTEDDAFRSLPLVTGSGLVDRVLELRVDPRELQLLQEAPLLMEWHEEVLGTIAEVLSLTLQNLQLHEQLEKQALMDPLTGISNRLHLTSQLEKEVLRSRREGKPLGLLFTDLDGFKQINDVLGHLVGDQLLVEVGQFLKDHFRESDHLCRYGGDEFVVIMPGSSIEDVKNKAEELLQAFRAHPFLDGRAEEASRLSLSLGVTQLRDGLNAESLLDEADSALYEAKRSGKDRCVIVEGNETSE